MFTVDLEASVVGVAAEGGRDSGVMLDSVPPPCGAVVFVMAGVVAAAATGGVVPPFDMTRGVDNDGVITFPPFLDAGVDLLVFLP